MNNEILIIGGGKLGHAMAELLKSQEAPVSIWDIDPLRQSPALPLSELVRRANLIFFCAPAHALRSTLQSVCELVPAECSFVCLSKGLDPTSGHFSHQVLTESLQNGQPYALIGGPMLAEELSMGTRAILASKFPEAAERVTSCFQTTNLRITISNDSAGVAICGVLKNIYSLVLGLSEGLDFTDNQRGSLLMKVVNEMTTLSIDLGAERETAMGYPGLGDLFATGLSHHSTNVSFGIEWAHGNKLPNTPEGVRSLLILTEHPPCNMTGFPVLGAATNIFLTGGDPQRTLKELI